MVMGLQTGGHLLSLHGYGLPLKTQLHLFIYFLSNKNLLGIPGMVVNSSHFQGGNTTISINVINESINVINEKSHCPKPLANTDGFI
jgi:hypothetical protein